MAISSLPALPSSLLNSGQASSSGNASTSAAADSGSLGKELLAALTQSGLGSSSSSGSLLQDMVSLSPTALGQASNITQTYNAQGLLNQVQSNLMLNDPLLQTDSGNGSSDNLFQSLMSMPQLANLPASQTAATQAATTTQDGSVTDNSSTQTTSAGTTDLNANWAQMLKQNPSLAGVLVQSQIDQGLLSMFGK